MDFTLPTVHFLKTHPHPFNAIWTGLKLFEWRKNDRGYKVGDHLVLQEYNPDTQAYTGYEIECEVIYLLEWGFGIPEGYCIMSINVLDWDEPSEKEGV